ncbi:MAG: hypothetical protein GF344_12765 [Chitinivibrionales bacterium]|nr:hypothetical protein [Chitinivibrionales bacterium]MBD3357615.1 hypothetical protein [Chitinivibrionales bacterium]
MIRLKKITQSPYITLVHSMDFVGFALRMRRNGLTTRLNRKRIHYLPITAWSLEKASNLIKTVTQCHLFRLILPNHRIIRLCNTPRERTLLRLFGAPAAFINHNIFANEHVFVPGNGKQEHDAIYNAKFQPFKRHWLAKEINSLALLSYCVGRSYNFNKQYFDQMASVLKHAATLNFDWASNYTFWGRKKVCAGLASAKVGLCLSAIEGAMVSSIEYLLCGMPVVSTESRGGRDIYFDERYTVITRDTPESVRDGVAEVIARNISPDTIRASTLTRLSEHRNSFVNLIAGIHKDEGATDIPSSWEEVFHDDPDERLAVEELEESAFVRELIS